MGRLIFLLINRIKKKYIRQVWNFSILVWIFLQEEVPSVRNRRRNKKITTFVRLW